MANGFHLKAKDSWWSVSAAFYGLFYWFDRRKSSYKPSFKLLYGLMGLRFSEEAEPMDADPDVLEYFIFSFTADFGEVMQDIIADEKE